MKNLKIHETLSFENFRDAVDRFAEMYGDDTAFSFKVKAHDKDVVKRSYIEMRDDVHALGSKLLELGAHNKHIAVIGKLTYEWVLVYYAALSVGAVLVPLDKDWGAAELSETAKRADIAYVFVDEDIKEKGEEIRAAIGADVLYTLTPEGESSVGALVEMGRELFAQDSAPYYSAEIDVDKMSLLVFTSGTTGKGKGVMLSQRNVITDLTEIIPYIAFTKKTVNVLPPHHTYGSSVGIFGHCVIGAESYISSGIRYVQKELKEQQPGHLVLVPLYLETFYRKIMANIKDQGKEKLIARMIKISNCLRKIGIDLRRKLFGQVLAAFGGKVEFIISGGAAISPEILDFFEGIGVTALNGYGITECAPIIAVNPTRMVVKGSVGPAIESDDVKLADMNEDGEGEICVKGPNVMLGYYKDEAATADAFDEDGYFKTGDYGKIDPKTGAIFITGRKKNLIILSNGKNVYPEEIESELVSVPGVIDVIVYEGQSKRGLMHNAIVAEIYPDKDYIEKNNITDIKAHLQPYVDAYNRTAVPYKKIGILKVRDEEFPKNTLRKIMRFKLDMTIE